MEVLREPPKHDGFVSLAEHQSTTPASFYSGPTVLHYYSDRSKVIVLEHELDRAPAFKPLLEKASAPQQSNGEGESNGHLAGSGRQRVVEDVDIWVTSDKLFLYSPVATAGIAIPYPSISLHAIQTLPEPSAGEQQGLYMQILSTADDIGMTGSEEDTEPESISVTIIPTAVAPPTTSATTESDPIADEDKPEQTPVRAMFVALSNCSNLHPDPVDPGDDEEDDEGGSQLFRAGLAIPGDASGGLPPAMPGSGGWITAENMHEFVDEEGNWIDDDNADEGEEKEAENLGPGAGTVRTREDRTDGQDQDGNGSEETKWQRTS